MAKTYPLYIENVGEDVYILMSRGHHDPHTFMNAIRDAGYDWPLGVPEHFWIKTMPPRNSNYVCSYCIVPKGTRGAFPATYVSEAWGDDSYEHWRDASGDRPNEA